MTTGSPTRGPGDAEARVVMAASTSLSGRAEEGANRIGEHDKWA